MFALTTTQFTGVRVVSKATAPKKSVNAVVSNGYTIDTERRRKMFDENKKRTAAAGEAEKAKAKALAEKNKAAQAKAVARKKELAEQRKANAAARKEATAKLNKTVGGSSKFKNSFTKAPAMTDPFESKKFKNSFKMPKVDLLNVKLWK